MMILSLLFWMTSIVQADEFDTGRVGMETRTAPLQVTGRIVPQEGALRVQSARSSGRILSILKKEGDLVQTGDPLFELSSAECSSLREEKKIAKDRGLTELLSSIEKRQTELSLSIEGKECLFLASNSGLLMKRNVESGTVVNSGDVLASILDPHKLTVELDVPEKVLEFIRIGQPVKFSLSSQSEKLRYSSKIEKIVPAIDSQTRTSKVRLTPVTLHSRFSLEMLVFAEVSVSKRETVFTVPNSALGFFKGRQYILIVSKGLPKAVQVEVLEEVDHISQIRPLTQSDLHTHDKVVVRKVPFYLNSILKGASVS